MTTYPAGRKKLRQPYHFLGKQIIVLQRAKRIFYVKPMKIHDILT